MDTFGAVCDDFYLSVRLFLKLELTPSRETLLHFFDRIRREYPSMNKMRPHEKGGYVLEEEPEEGDTRRWIRVDCDSMRFGVFAPDDMEEVRCFGELIMSQAPYHLTFSDLDFDHLEVLYAFDLEYRGNHDELVADTLISDTPEASFLQCGQSRRVIDAQPYYGIALNADCDLQAYLEVKSRTSTYEIRSDSFESKPITVFLTIRKYWSINQPASLAEGLIVLLDHGDELASEKIVPQFVNPLAAAIASRS